MKQKRQKSWILWRTFSAKVVKKELMANVLLCGLLFSEQRNVAVLKGFFPPSDLVHGGNFHLGRSFPVEHPPPLGRQFNGSDRMNMRERIGSSDGNQLERFNWLLV